MWPVPHRQSDLAILKASKFPTAAATQPQLPRCASDPAQGITFLNRTATRADTVTALLRHNAR